MSARHDVVAQARARFLADFAWHEGHADMWRVFEDADSWGLVIAALAEPWVDAGVSRVVGIESRGFLLGGAVAARMGLGFHAIRKTDGLLAGTKISQTTSAPDYRGRTHTLRMRDSLTPSDRVLLVDDWAERGSQALAARRLVEQSGAEFVGLSLIVNQLPETVVAELGRVTWLVTGAELLARPDYER